jgi:hypothetical protein
MNLGWMAALLALLAGCASAPRIVHLNTGQTGALVFTPRSDAEPVKLNGNAFKTSVAKRAREVRLSIRPQEAARKLFEVGARSGSYLYETRSRRVTQLGPDEQLEGAPLAEEVELTRAYLRWCERTGTPGDCLRLLQGSPIVNGDGRFALALALARGAVLDEMLEAFRDMADPHAMVAAVLWTWTTYMVLISLPDVTVSKGLAAVMTATLIAYVGINTFWGLVVGFTRMMNEAERVPRAIRSRRVVLSSRSRMRTSMFPSTTLTVWLRRGQSNDNCSSMLLTSSMERSAHRPQPPKGPSSRAPSRSMTGSDELRT